MLHLYHLLYSVLIALLLGRGMVVQIGKKKMGVISRMWFLCTVSRESGGV